MVAAPLNEAGDVEEPESVPVFDGLAGLIGEPVADEPEPEPDPALADGADVPVARAAVPVANPVEPAIAEELLYS